MHTYIYIYIYIYIQPRCLTRNPAGLDRGRFRAEPSSNACRSTAGTWYFKGNSRTFDVGRLSYVLLWVSCFVARSTINYPKVQKMFARIPNWST